MGEGLVIGDYGEVISSTSGVVKSRTRSRCPPKVQEGPWGYAAGTTERTAAPGERGYDMMMKRIAAGALLAVMMLGVAPVQRPLTRGVQSAKSATFLPIPLGGLFLRLILSKSVLRLPSRSCSPSSRPTHDKRFLKC